MKVKRYVGQSVEDTLQKIKDEMGNNAIILNKRRIKPGKGILRIFKKPVYEILAAIDEYEYKADIASQTTDGGYRVLEEKVDKLNTTIDTIINKMAPDNQEELPDILAPYYALMKDNDIDPEIIHFIMEGVRNKINLNTTYDQEYLYYKFKQEIAACFKKIKPIELLTGEPAIAVFVGPTGVGKTTTLAKLAAHYAVIMKKKVSIITCDTYRIAAVDQLKTYSEIMNVPIKVVYQYKDIEDAILEYKDMDVILVDTAGGSHRDKMKIMELKKMLKCLGKQQTFLVISATTNYKNSIDIISSYSFLKDYRILITKVDESIANGLILNLAVKSSRALSYITTGQNVPDDIEKVDGDRIASLILSRQ
jgi:flagellar biosynthesis protein FlhF